MYRTFDNNNILPFEQNVTRLMFPWANSVNLQWHLSISLSAQETVHCQLRDKAISRYR